MSDQKKQNLADPKIRKRFVTYKEAAELYSMGLTRTGACKDCGCNLQNGK